MQATRIQLFPKANFAVSIYAQHSFVNIIIYAKKVQVNDDTEKFLLHFDTTIQFFGNSRFSAVILLQRGYIK